ncbi:MAG: LarC family nickel insertion protein [Clostridiales bacterium]|nr:LarC family nickel insertion protein [Clostridiales bacterium]
MKTIYLHCENGVSGDMVLNALTDLTDDPQAVHSEINRISHEIGHAHTHHNHEHHHEHEHSHFHRSYNEVKNIIDAADIDNEVKAVAQQIYAVIAKAESAVHGDSLEELHFHEVGRDQAIANVLGVALCINALRADHITVSEICDGHGTVQCAHGILEVPVPAVRAMLDNCNLVYRQTEYEGEMVTPSGLAMVIGIGAVTGDEPMGEPVRKAEAFGGRRVGEHGLIAELYMD